MLHPDLAFGESYMDGDLQIESVDIDDLIALLAANWKHWQNHWLERLVLALDTRLARFNGLNSPGRAKRNVAHHYDLKDSLFDNFFDPWRQYFCAYFRSSDEPLADTQITKLSRIVAKLRLPPSDHVLDIGCGWSGRAFALATVEPEAKVTGITLSENQLAFAGDTVRTTLQANRFSFALRDYRQQTGRFDKIVSVGMLEHVGAKHYDNYFAGIARLLAANGLALVHLIAVN
jgi:cyclopropane-fatty-acyl-phospholipid synthase